MTTYHVIACDFSTQSKNSMHSDELSIEWSGVDKGVITTNQHGENIAPGITHHAIFRIAE